VHASCAAWDEAGVLIMGAPGSGKSDLLLRLIDRGWALVAEDQVIVEQLGEEGWARPPERLAGLIEIRGLGLLRLPWLARVRLALVVQLGQAARLPEPTRYPNLDLPMVTIDPSRLAAPLMVSLALGAAQGKQDFVAGAFETRQQASSL